MDPQRPGGYTPYHSYHIPATRDLPAASSASANMPPHQASLNLARLSENSLLAIAQFKLLNNERHQRLAERAHQGMIDNTLLFKSSEGFKAHFGQSEFFPDGRMGSLLVSVQLNQQQQYELTSISLHMHDTGEIEKYHLAALPPAPPSSAMRPKPGDLVDDPAHPGEKITYSTLQRRENYHKQVADPNNPGETVSQGTLSKRKLVDDPEKPGQMMTASALQNRNYRRKLVDDPNKPGEKISPRVLKGREKIDDPENPGKQITRSALDTRNSDRRLVDDPDNPGQQITKGQLRRRKNK